MITRFIRRVSVVMALIFCVISVCTIAYAEEGSSSQQTHDYKVISCNTQGGHGTAIPIQYVYSDSMLTGSAIGLNPELAKISSILAGAAYDPNNAKINAILSSIEMGFTRQLLVNYGRSMPIDDCHHVAFSVWTKVIDDYLVYCVPVRGTTGNGEWYSDFTLKSDFDAGYEGKHYGFYKAAHEVRNRLWELFSNDDWPNNKTKLWITGHSRGAAVANIVAGEMKGTLSAENIYGYNFACPGVSKNVTDDGNIFNFINNGDMIPTVPLESWGYHRYGHDILNSPRYVPGFEPLFSEISGHEYDGANSSHPYVGLLTTIVPTEDDFDVALPLLMYAANAMDKSDSTLTEVYTYLADCALLAAPDNIFDLFKKVILNGGPLSLNSIIERVNKAITRYEGWCEFLHYSCQLFDGMDEEEIQNYISENQTYIDTIETELEMTLNSKDAFSAGYHAAQTLKAFVDGQKSALEMIKSFASQVGDVKANRNGIYYNETGKVTTVNWKALDEHTIRIDMAQDVRRYESGAHVIITLYVDDHALKAEVTDGDGAKLFEMSAVETDAFEIEPMSDREDAVEITPELLSELVAMIEETTQDAPDAAVEEDTGSYEDGAYEDDANASEDAVAIEAGESSTD